MKFIKSIFRVFCVCLFLLFTWPFFLYKKYGNSHLKLKKPTIIISNHYSTFDPFFVYLLFFKHRITFLAIAETKQKLIPRFVTWLFDCIFLKSNSLNAGALMRAMKSLKNDNIICVYPEGVINPRKFGFFDFHKSYLLMAEKTKSYILPIYIYPKLKLFKKSKIYIGEQVPYENYIKYKDLDERNAYFLSLIMDYSFKVEDNSDID